MDPQDMSNTPTGILSLPPEILLIIASFLNLTSAACLALCSRRIAFSIGGPIFHDLRTPDQKKKRRRVLRLIEKDLPGLLFCYTCDKLHLAPKEGPRAVWQGSKEPHCVQMEGSVPMMSNYRIRFSHVQQLMWNYRLGRHDEVALDLKRLSHRYAHTSGMYRPVPIHELWVEIDKDSEALLRHRQSIRLDPDDHFYEDTFFGVTPCTHLYRIYGIAAEARKHRRIDWRRGKRMGAWIDLVPGSMPPVSYNSQCYLVAEKVDTEAGKAQRVEAIVGCGTASSLCWACRGDELPCEKCHGKQHCEICSTWFQVNRIDKFDVQIDIGKNLGKCETPQDKAWRSHVESLEGDSIQLANGNGGRMRHSTIRYDETEKVY